ncbi:uncharacterized protein I303_106218 [Kwoniella dejecticola CBS 10117]|uniref:RWD domain-containing protein n=1 Tax=Kwoniella dejecticola CBS 10117 TaxID=1296121 RepID=A0A1A6A1N2_9TREE|nr:uncharacterized protein I303_06237 [Kwoniella dejecticola CBS 10117]OBR83950.1 hypothetical protein I303_06237 [Kwoniella dejecticola CBS 10117]
MSDYKAILEEEFEVLESIFPDELEKLSDTSVSIRIEPEEQSFSDPIALSLIINYPDTYPDVIPDISLEEIDGEGELQEGEEDVVLENLRSIAEESLGMAMTFTIASAAKEALALLIVERARKEKEADDKRAREYEEAEAARTRGTPLTKELFDKWRKSFTAEIKAKRDKEEEDRVKALISKEREEYRKRKERPTGRQLFENSTALATSDEGLYEEGVQEVDMRKYTREEREAERRREEEEEERRRSGLVRDGDSDNE